MQFIVHVLNDYLKNSLELDEDKVILNKIIESDGSIPVSNSNKIVFTLIHLEEATFMKQENLTIKENSETYNDKKHFSAYVAVSFSFDDYIESLKFLDISLAFFHENGNYNSALHPNFPQELDIITVDIYPITFEQKCNLIDSLEIKNTPFVVLKLSAISK